MLVLCDDEKFQFQKRLVIEEKHSIVFKFLMPAFVMPIAMLREWACIVNCPKTLYAYICLSYILCVSALSAASQWRRLLASVPSRNIGHQSAFFLPSSTFSSFASFFMFIFIVSCSDSAVCLPALQTWCTRSSVAYLSQRPVVVQSQFIVSKY